MTIRWNLCPFIYLFIILLGSIVDLQCFRCTARLIQLYIYTCIIFQIIFHYRILKDLNYSFLYYRVNLCCLLPIYTFYWNLESRHLAEFLERTDVTNCQKRAAESCQMALRGQLSQGRCQTAVQTGSSSSLPRTQPIWTDWSLVSLSKAVTSHEKRQKPG